jgi:hypothetical protein
MAEVLEDMNEEGFGDSDNEADDMLDHDDAMVEALEERRQLAGVEEDKTVEFNDSNAILLQKGATGPELKLPGPPTTSWLAPTRKVARGEPLFIDVDNPGGWDEYVHTFRVFYKRQEVREAYATYWSIPSCGSRWEAHGGTVGILLWRMERLGKQQLQIWG